MAPAGAKAGRQGDLATKGEVGQDRHCLSPRGPQGTPCFVESIPVGLVASSPAEAQQMLWRRGW